jgi:NAD(P)-dependent dehydrogenase (short-subunit alcohol dehydrogenase family)
LGLAIAHAYAAAGADVAVCARDGALLASAAESLQAEYPGVTVRALAADIADRASVDELFAAVDEAFGNLDILVCNAGVLGPKGALDDLDWQAWIDALQINLIGTAYCARRALRSLGGSGRSKILIVSGGGATKPMPYLSAYSASKAGLVRFGETLAEELRERNIDVNMVAPGALNTRLLDEVLAAGPERIGSAYYAAARKQQESGGFPPAAAAQLCVFLASPESDGISGKLISAPWDPWQRFGGESGRLAGDLYTLRRIIPEDRGWSW